MDDIHAMSGASQYPIEDRLKDAEREIERLEAKLCDDHVRIRERCIQMARVDVSTVGAEEQTVGGWISRADALAQYIIHGKEKPE